MTNWWEENPMSQRGATAHSEPKPDWTPNPAPVTPADPVGEVAQNDPPADRRKSLLLGAVGAAVVGAVLFVSLPDGGSDPAALPTASATASQGDPLPAAGGNDMPPSPQESVAPKVVTLTMQPSGSGRVGAVVKVTIHNDTDNTIVVVPSMMKGDEQPALLGEGTLARSAREIEPGGVATGTVEFAAKKPPTQVVLFDIGGNVVAASA